MLFQASVGELQRDRITKSMGRIVVCMRFYPRFLKRSLCHDYVRALAPGEDLFTDFRAKLEELDNHNEAFDAVDYENRFKLTEEGLIELTKLAEEAQSKDVFLVCQCEKNQKCHRELLLMLAHHRFGTPIDRLRFDYPAFAKRLSSSPAL